MQKCQNQYLWDWCMIVQRYNYFGNHIHERKHIYRGLCASPHWILSPLLVADIVHQIQLNLQNLHLVQTKSVTLAPEETRGNKKPSDINALTLSKPQQCT